MMTSMMPVNLTVDSGSCSWVNQEILTGDRMRIDSLYIAQTELTKLTKDVEAMKNYIANEQLIVSHLTEENEEQLEPELFFREQQKSEF